MYSIKKLTISLFFESIASDQKHPEILEEVSLQDQAPYIGSVVHFISSKFLSRNNLDFGSTWLLVYTSAAKIQNL